MIKPLVFGAALLSASAMTVPLAAQDRVRDDTFTITANQIVDMADARIAQLKADLRLTPDQDKNWGSFQSALHDMALRRGDRMTKLRDQRNGTTTDAAAPAPAPVVGTAPAPVVGTAPVTDPAARPRDDRDMRDARDARDRRDMRDSDRYRAPDLVGDLRRQADDLAAKSDDFRKFADAAGPLYTSLNDGQKGRFLAYVQRNLLEDPMVAEPRRGRGRGRYRY